MQATLETPDAWLLTAIRGRDSTAFEVVFARYQGRIRGMCRNYLHDADAADDLVQETFCTLVETAHRVHDGFNLSAWIHTIAANLCHDELRRRARRMKVHMTGGSDAELAMLQLIDNDGLARPEAALEAKCTRAIIHEAMRRVPRRQRDVLVLRDVHGLSYREIAATLGLSPGAIHGVLHRARERFKAEYVALEGSQDSEGECAKVGYLLSTIGWRTVRRDRLRSVEHHLAVCSSCRERHGGRMRRSELAAAG